MLDERKLNILYAIIDSYITNAEPVGSRTITKKYDLGVSSATIRNEMSDLEDLGLLNKTHSSSGRVPSDKAYRMYVDSLMNVNTNESFKNTKRVEEILRSQSGEIKSILLNASKLLSAITNYTTVLQIPSLSSTRIKYFNLSYMGEKEVLLTFINDKGTVKNTVLILDQAVDSSDIYRLSEILNNILKGALVSDIPKLVEKTFDELRAYESLIDSLLPILKRELEEETEPRIRLEGITKIFEYPEYEDINKARNLLNFFENEDLIFELFSLGDNQEIDISIGSENPYEEVKNCSIITTSYFADGFITGKIGLIGPTRMDYGNVISTLRTFHKNVDNIIKDMTKE